MTDLPDADAVAADLQTLRDGLGELVARIDRVLRRSRDMAYETVGDVRAAYTEKYRPESYEEWLELELIESNEFVVGYSRRRKALNAALELPETTGWDAALERVKRLVEEAEEFARVRGDYGGKKG